MKVDQRAVLFARLERLTDVPMLVLSIVFLILVLLPEVVQLSQGAIEVLDGIVWLIWGVFAVELVIKTYLAPQRRRYLIAHWPDVLMVVLPFLRPLRLLRAFVGLMRVWKLAQTVLQQRTFSFIGVTSLVTVVLSAIMVYAAEHSHGGPIQNFPDALWWALTTITTVGYGDMYPKTPLGRGVAVFLMLTGITLFGLLTARVAAFFVQEETPPKGEEKLDEILARLAQLEHLLTEHNPQRHRDRLP